MIAAIVYILCAVTSSCCAFLLLRKAHQPRAGLLFWSGLSFLIFAVGNVMLVIDLLVVPQYDLLLIRQTVTFVAVALLLYGLIWETE